MKINKINLLSFCAGALILGGCSNEDVPLIDPNAQDSQVSIMLTISVEGNVELQGRSVRNLNNAPRQMLNQRSQQCVNDLRIYVFGSDTADGDFLYEGGGDQADGGFLVTSEGVFNNYYPWSGGSRETHNYELKADLKPERYYKLLAVGRDDKDAPQITPEAWASIYPWWFGYKTVKDIEFVVGQTKFDEASIEISRNPQTNSLYEPNYVTEIFSGFLADSEGAPKSLYLASEIKNYVGTVLLDRAVAGIYTLITNIPYRVLDDETGLEFTPDEVNLLLEVCATKTNLVTNKDVSDEYFRDVIIGQVDLRYTTIYNPNPWNHNDEIFLREGCTYKDIEIPANTALMSNFIMPSEYQVIDDEFDATLFIQYYKSLNGGHLIRSQKLKCDIIGVQELGENPSGIEQVEEDENFPILSNKLYILCEDYDITKPFDMSKVTRIKEKSE